VTRAAEQVALAFGQELRSIDSALLGLVEPATTYPR